MTDSRAALEERARQKRYALVSLARKAIERKVFGLENTAMFDDEQLADFAEDYAEQESSSLKLLLSAMCRARADLWTVPRCMLNIATECGIVKEFPVELDSSGIPVLTPEIIEALKAAK